MRDLSYDLTNTVGATFIKQSLILVQILYGMPQPLSPSGEAHCSYVDNVIIWQSSLPSISYTHTPQISCNTSFCFSASPQITTTQLALPSPPL